MSEATSQAPEAPAAEEERSATDPHERAALLVFLVGGPALYVLVAAHAPLGLILGFALIDGSSGAFFNTVWYTAIQREIPPNELSRVTSWDYLGSLAMQPLGLALTGPVAGVLGVSTTLYCSAAIFVLLLVAVLAVPAVRNFGDPAHLDCPSWVNKQINISH